MKIKPRARAIAAMVTLSACVPCGAEPVALATFMALPRPSPTTVLPYGEAASQAIDIFIPSGRGPHPVAILIHGGCWSERTAGREQLRHLGAELSQRGMAVWSMGYRRADEIGGGYPGTFRDIASGMDLLQTAAPRYNLDLSRNVVVGHSAGGHLALWSMARHGIAAQSPLRHEKPFIPNAAISLAGVGDFQAFARFVPVICGPGIVDKLVPGGLPAADAYADISPAAMAPPTGPVVLFSAVLDRLIPPYVAYEFSRHLQTKHSKSAELVEVVGAGHFDLVTPGTHAWLLVRARIEATLSVKP